MYKISKDNRKYSTTPIVRVDVVNGKEKEIPVLYSRLPKKEGDVFMKKVVRLLNKKNDVIFDTSADSLFPYYTHEFLPHNSIDEVNATIPLSKRYIGLTVNIKGKEYWYVNDIYDNCLKEKN